MNRKKLLEAAARVYAESGFRGATTRRIAEEAGVNEVTLFRLFGSKAHLIAEAIQCVDPMAIAELPREPRDPQLELAEWCRAHSRAMYESRSAIRKTMADLEEHPELRQFIGEGKSRHFTKLLDYAMKLVRPTTVQQEQDVFTACSMLFSGIFSYAMGRDISPSVYPSPDEEAADRYVRVFLRALGVAGGGNPSATDEPVAVGNR